MEKFLSREKEHHNLGHVFLNIGIIFYIFHNIRYFTIEQGAKLINGIGSNTFTLLDCVICGTGKAPLCKLIRTDFFLFHGLEQWFVTNHIHTSYLDYMGTLGN